MEGIAEQASLPTLTTHILTAYPGFDRAQVNRLRNQYWNAIKHFYARDNRAARDDEALMADFSDASNDAVLFMGWLNYMAVVKRLPIEVQVFQVWWYATDERRMSEKVDPTLWQTLFPNIAADTRRDQKRRLREAIEAYRDDPEIRSQPGNRTRAACTADLDVLLGEVIRVARDG